MRCGPLIQVSYRRICWHGIGDRDICSCPLSVELWIGAGRARRIVGVTAGSGDRRNIGG